ncbi:MAG: hypothetical protein IJP98_01195 [Clostridia bacterium]|nr:hypothetical protein [Clostridia bacterium]
MKRVVAWLLALCLLTGGLFACKTETAHDPNEGTYRAVAAVFDGRRIGIETLYDDELLIELQADGQGMMHSGAEVVPFSWSVSGSAFHGTDGNDETIDGTIQNGVLVLRNFVNTGVTIVFSGSDDRNAVETVLANLAPTPVPTPEPTAVPQVFDPSYWAGKWYGYLVLTDGEGAYADTVNLAMDMVGELTVEGETGRFVLRNYYAPDGPSTADVLVRFEQGASEAGRMVSVSGWNYGSAISAGDWTVDPQIGSMAQFDRMIEISATQTDEAGHSFAYSYYLRPWGMDWEDVRAADTTDLPFWDMLPSHYDCWYVYAANLTAESDDAAAALIGSWTNGESTYTFLGDGTGAYADGESETPFGYTTFGCTIEMQFDGTVRQTAFHIEETTLRLWNDFSTETLFERKN